MRQIKKEEVDLLAEHTDSELEDIDMLFARFGLESSEAKQLRKALVDHGLEHRRLQRDDRLLLNSTRDAYYRAHIEELSGIDIETKIAHLLDQDFPLHPQLLDSYQIRFSIDQQMRPGDDFIRGTVDFTPTIEGSISATESHRDFNSSNAEHRAFEHPY
jgi:hypothetical protein